MKRLRKLNLNIQLLAVFFAAVLILSLGHFVLYTHLLTSMQKEETLVAQERNDTVRMKLENIYSHSEKLALEIITSWSFQAMAGGDAGYEELTTMQNEAQEILDDQDFIHHWFIMVQGSDQLITGNGVCAPDTFFDGIHVSERYTTAYWQDQFRNHPGKFYHPAELMQSRHINGQYEQVRLMPMSFQSYYDRQLMVVLMLDVEQICREDTYLETGAYFFAEEDGSLLYTTDSEPVITQLPEQTESIKTGGQTYQLTRYEMKGGPICIKLRSEGETAGLMQQNLILCLVVVAVALLAFGLMMPKIIKALLNPVDKMVDLVRQHADPEETDLHGVSRGLEEIIKSREQQAAALAQTHAALSEYKLQSRLKNVYVDLQLPESRDEDGYLLFVQVRYQEKMLESFSISRAELENCLQEMMSDTLGKLFAEATLFQLEPGRFAARVTLPEDQADVLPLLERFLERLRQEEEFACFTVVASQLQAQEELAQVYDRIRQTARLAKLTPCCQLLTLPEAEETTAYTYPKPEEQRLEELIREGKIPQAALCAERLLTRNIDAGISHAQMEDLCVSVVNTVAYAAAANGAAGQKTAASVVYNALATRCLSGQDYRDVVDGYIRGVEPEEQVSDEDLLLGKIRQYLQDNYHKEFSSEEMAAALWVSRSYLSSYYKNKTGMNLSDSIQQYRITKAMELLRDPEVKISDVGAMVGINSPNTFLRQFRKYTGVTPREYRQGQLTSDD